MAAVTPRNSFKPLFPGPWHSLIRRGASSSESIRRSAARCNALLRTFLVGTARPFAGAREAI